MTDLKIELHKCKDIVASCAPDTTSELRAVLRKKFCSKLMTGEGAGGPENAVASESMRVLKYLGLAFVVVVLVVFYILILLWRQESSFSDDLESSFWERLMRRIKRGRKQKGY
jgi:hypothetical protein